MINVMIPQVVVLKNVNSSAESSAIGITNIKETRKIILNDISDYIEEKKILEFKHTEMSLALQIITSLMYNPLKHNASPFSAAF